MKVEAASLAGSVLIRLGAGEMAVAFNLSPDSAMELAARICEAAADAEVWGERVSAALRKDMAR